MAVSPGPPVVQPSTVSPAAAPDSVTANDTSSPSGAVEADVAKTDTVSPPASVIVVLAGVVSTVTVPAAVLAPVSVTTSVSPGSSTSSARVRMVMVPSSSPAAIVRVPLGAV